MKASKIKLKVKLLKLNERIDKDGNLWYDRYSITQMYSIVTNKQTPDVPRLYITKIKGNDKKLVYTIIFETISDRKEATNYLYKVLYNDDIFAKGFDLIYLK